MTVSRLLGLDILFLVPPFASVRMPMIGPSLLAAQCRKEGFRAAVLYANVEFARRLGLDLYERVAFSSLDLMLGDLAFRASAFDGSGHASFRETVDSHFGNVGALSVADQMGAPLRRDEILHLGDCADRYVADLAERVAGLRPKVVGFSCMFQQTVASAGIARRLKQLEPSIVTVVGGSNVAGAMGESLSRQIPCFDHVVSGEAETTVGELLRHYAAGSPLSPPPRFIGSRGGVRMDDLPVPDFDDYFAAEPETLARSQSVSTFEISLPVESSRGCWWGQKHHCTFCGLNGLDMAFREKSRAVFVSEVRTLQRRYGINKFQAVDNIMPRSLCAGALRDFADFDRKIELFYEIKSNVTEDQLDQFVKAGVNAVQPGIESLSSETLIRMKKGVTGRKNLWLLRECASRRIDVIWNALVDFPGDGMEEYQQVMELIPSIVHLAPPREVSPIIIDRFSPYFDFPSEHGIRRVEPMAAYARLYPSGFKIDSIAYHFVGEYDSAWRADEALRRRFAQAVGEWKLRWTAPASRPKLYRAELGGGRYFIEDSRRQGSVSRYALDREQSRLLDHCDTERRALPGFQATAIEELMRLRLIVHYEGSYLSVVTDPAKWVRLVEPANREVMPA